MRQTTRRDHARRAVALVVAVFAALALVGPAPQAGAQAAQCDISDFIVDGNVNTTGYLICIGAGPTNPAPDCPTADERVNGIADPNQVRPGGNTTFSGYGFAPNSQVEIFLCSTPISLGTFTADALGNIVAQVTIPTGVTLGAHTLAAVGTGASGQSRVVYAAITVIGDQVTTTTQGGGQLPRTGAETGRLVAIGAAMILLGGTALAGSLRSRRQSA